MIGLGAEEIAPDRRPLRVLAERTDVAGRCHEFLEAEREQRREAR
jgi:hypothetical protein